MRFLIAGASGFLGTQLRASLTRTGHEVTALVRRTPGAGQARWDPYADDPSAALDPALVEQADVVVNLAGAPTLGNPHSTTWATQLRDSRVTTTRVLAEAIAASSRRPAFLAGNGISFYGDHGADPVTESAESRGEAFLTGVTVAWQDATSAAVEAGARVCVLRTAPVLDRRNAPLKQLRLLFKSGLGGRIGDGKQYFPVISTQDWVAAVTFLGEHDEVAGPVNLSCPVAPTNAEFTRELAAAVHRPAFLPVPAAIIRPAAGRMSSELLGSIRAVPEVLIEGGFRFADQDVAAILRGVG
ncbi:TIGR01777 family protein [Nocardioides marmoriginsengisoli]|uniref:TIGR01777 family protein n=1 Tax=Nocardioides marmoriginsengisoli TaxID=661483 RepID=A0A3N0CLE8_9ACTN|nr:TIGR01777 family oxidoreductase [Nocardioides marmoriginsengisoli]RNL64278.1 TIGR01777 family protein [Nocardioides marmoriginsengisoli]